MLLQWPEPVLAEEPPARNRIVVVDDDPDVRLVFQQSLQLARFDVVVAGSGAEGFRILRDDPTVGLVLLDLMMPEMDGWRFRHAQRLDPRLAAIPTIIVSGCALATIVHEELQAADYLLKPVAREHLISVIAFYCKPLDDVGLEPRGQGQRISRLATS